MLPRAVFDRVGGWDAGFFMFNEDVDFCKRVHEAGMRVVYVPDAVVYHAIGVSKRAPARIVVERHKSMWRYYRKHMRGNVLQDVGDGGGDHRAMWVDVGDTITRPCEPIGTFVSGAIMPCSTLEGVGSKYEQGHGHQETAIGEAT